MGDAARTQRLQLALAQAYSEPMDSGLKRTAIQVLSAWMMDRDAFIDVAATLQPEGMNLEKSRIELVSTLHRLTGKKPLLSTEKFQDQSGSVSDGWIVVEH